MMEQFDLLRRDVLKSKTVWAPKFRTSIKKRLAMRLPPSGSATPVSPTSPAAAGKVVSPGDVEMQV